MSRKITRFRRSHTAPAPEAKPTSGDAAQPAASEPPPARGPRLDADDLEALMNMDPGDLDALMGASTARPRVREGDRIEGTIVRIERDSVFVEVGAKSEGVLDRAELREERVGDTITAFVLAVDDDGVRLSRQLSGDAAAEFLLEAAASGVPVEGVVTRRNAGGYEVRVGSVRAFVPVSHMHRTAPADPDACIGQTLTFQVLESADEPVLSRRGLLEAEAEAARSTFLETARPGDVHVGLVTAVQPYGVFVDLGGAEGLVHKSELGWDASDDALSKLTRGQRLEVRILEIDPTSQKIALSAKDPSASPWALVGTDFVAGGTYEGTVTGVERYGAFVKLASGLQGLLHASRRVGSAQPRVGETLTVRLIGIDRERRRLELADPEWEGAGGATSDEDAAWRDFKGKRDDQGSLGTLGDLLKGLKVDR